jgi:phospholipid/cholesterol/gamma-HCH transport system substrate-binding protein
METKANHILIGAVTIALLLGVLAFVGWLANSASNEARARYLVYFDGAVDGLGVGGDVRFNGLRVGQVKQLRIDPDDPRRVEATIEIAADTPVREDSVAQLALQGITGIAFVQISAGSARSARLVPAEGQTLAVIRFRPSPIQEVFEGAPMLLANGNQLVQNLNKVVDDDNRRVMAETLRNLQQLSANLAASSERLDAMMTSLDGTARQLDGLAKQGSKTLANVDGIINEDVKPLVGDTRKSIQAIGRLTSQVDAIVADNRDTLNDFASEGLPQFGRLMAETRQLVVTLERVAARLESDPARFFFGNQRPEYEAR